MLSLLVCSLATCGFKPSAERDYLDRMSNVLDVPLDADISALSYPTFPTTRELHFVAERGDLSIREFLSLRECKLHTTLAHRNSLIGKVATASQLLFSDLRILQQGPECIRQLDETALATKLKTFIALKESQIERNLWSAILAQTEHRQFWHPRNYSHDYLVNAEPDINSLNALAEFSRQVLNGEVGFSDADFELVEQHLGRLRHGDGGQLLSNYVEQINTLQQANIVIQTRLKRPLCFESKTSQQARYFDNVVRSFFINKVQANAVKLNQRAEKLIFAHQQLEAPLLKFANKPYQTWASSRDNLLAKGKTAATEHAKLIQLLYAQCNLMPGNPR